MRKNENAQPELVEVTLLQEHIHGVLAFKAGTKIKVRKAQAEWLKKQGVIE